MDRCEVIGGDMLQGVPGGADAYLVKRVLGDLRFMDFSIIPGRSSYLFWRLGIVDLWQRRFTPRPPRAASQAGSSRGVEVAPLAGPPEPALP